MLTTYIAPLQYYYGAISGKVIVECLPMISTEGLTLDDVPALTEKTAQAMEAAFEAISNESHKQAVTDGTSIVMDAPH